MSESEPWRSQILLSAIDAVRYKSSCRNGTNDDCWANLSVVFINIIKCMFFGKDVYQKIECKNFGLCEQGSETEKVTIALDPSGGDYDSYGILEIEIYNDSAENLVMKVVNTTARSSGNKGWYAYFKSVAGKAVNVFLHYAVSGIARFFNGGLYGFGEPFVLMSSGTTEYNAETIIDTHLLAALHKVRFKSDIDRLKTIIKVLQVLKAFFESYNIAKLSVLEEFRDSLKQLSNPEEVLNDLRAKLASGADKLGADIANRAETLKQFNPKQALDDLVMKLASGPDTREAEIATRIESIKTGIANGIKEITEINILDINGLKKFLGDKFPNLQEILKKEKELTSYAELKVKAYTDMSEPDDSDMTKERNLKLQAEERKDKHDRQMMDYRTRYEIQHIVNRAARISENQDCFAAFMKLVTNTIKAKLRKRKPLDPPSHYSLREKLRVRAEQTYIDGWNRFVDSLTLEFQCVENLIQFGDPTCSAVKIFVRVNLPVLPIEVSFIHIPPRQNETEPCLLLYVNLDHIQAAFPIPNVIDVGIPGIKFSEVIKDAIGLNSKGLLYLYPYVKTASTDWSDQIIFIQGDTRTKLMEYIAYRGAENTHLNREDASNSNKEEVCRTLSDRIERYIEMLENRR